MSLKKGSKKRLQKGHQNEKRTKETICSIALCVIELWLQEMLRLVALWTGRTSLGLFLQPLQKNSSIEDNKFG